jgi:phosphoglycolate phosphatase-like HAD superfamily hydrolase
MNLPKILLFDLDETIFFSEEIKTKAWTDILRTFGYCWEKENVDDLTSVPKELRPKTGLSPHDFIKELLINLELVSPNATNEDGLESTVQEMKNQWTTSLISWVKQFALEGEIKEVPGASSVIKEAKKNGFRIGVVTQAPVEYANEVLCYLGLIDSQNEQNNVIDALVSGDMVTNPKPDPESLILACKLIYQKELPGNYFFGPGETVYPSPLAVIGDTSADIDAGRRYPGTSKIIKILINSRNLTPEEVREINPDLMINNFSGLISRLEGYKKRGVEKR